MSEERLKEIKNIFDIADIYGDDFEIARELYNEVISLQKRNKEIYDGFIATQEELSDYAEENEKLKSRKEKAVKYINCNKQKIISAYGDNEDDDFEICLWEEDIDNLLNILNGRSDE